MFVGKEHPLQSSCPGRHPAPSSAPAHTSPRFDQERENASFILSNLHALFLAQKPQPSHSQKLAHSFTHAENLTPAFPTISALSLRSSAGVRKSSPVFSCAPALFVKSTREGVGAKAHTPRFPAYAGAFEPKSASERKSPVRGAFAVSKSGGAFAVSKSSTAFGKQVKGSFDG